MDKYKLKHNLVLVLCAHYLLCRVKRILNSPGRGGRGRHLFDVNTVLWAQFYAESHPCPLLDKPAKSAIWWTWIFKLLTAVIPETVQYLSNTGYGSFFRRTTSAYERETRVSVHIYWKASACKDKSSQVRGTTSPNSHLYCLFVPRYRFWCSYLFSRI